MLKETSRNEKSEKKNTKAHYDIACMAHDKAKYFLLKDQQKVCRLRKSIQVFFIINIFYLFIFSFHGKILLLIESKVDFTLFFHLIFWAE